MFLEYSTSWLRSLAIMTALLSGVTTTRADVIRPISTITDGFRAKYNTVAHAFLNNEAAASTVTQEMYDFIDALIDEAKARIPTKPSYTLEEAKGALTTIDEILTRKNVAYPADSAGMGLVHQLSDGLRGRVMNSAEINALATTVTTDAAPTKSATMLRSLSSSMIAIPLRFSIWRSEKFLDCRYFSPKFPATTSLQFDDGTLVFDWETMDAVIAPPGHYQRLWNIPDALVQNRVYLSALNRQDVIGYHASITAEIWAKKQSDLRTFDDDMRAAAMYSRGPRVWNQLAWHRLTASDRNLRDGRSALESATKAVSISRTPNLLDTLACAYAELGNFDNAIQVETEAKTLSASGNFPREVEVPDFSAQLLLFSQRKTCAETPTASVAAVEKTSSRRLSSSRIA